MMKSLHERLVEIHGSHLARHKKREIKKERYWESCLLDGAKRSEVREAKFRLETQEVELFRAWAAKEKLTVSITEDEGEDSIFFRIAVVRW